MCVEVFEESATCWTLPLFTFTGFHVLFLIGVVETALEKPGTPWALEQGFRLGVFVVVELVTSEVGRVLEPFVTGVTAHAFRANGLML